MEITKHLNEFFNKPSQIGDEPFGKLDEFSTFSDSICPRLCFLAQTIASIIALPFLLLAGIFEAIINLFCEHEGPGSLLFMTKRIGEQIFVTLPMSLIIATTPTGISKSVVDGWCNCVGRIFI